MKSWIVLACVTLTALPAFATDVTNLDKVPHRVLFQSAGAKDVRTIQPGDKEYFAGKTSGFISLLSAPNPKPSQGTLHADGILSGIIGAERTEQIPADALDSFVIWPDGTIAIQQHRRGSRYNN